MCSGQHHPRRSCRFGQSEDYVGLTEPGACEGMGRKPGSQRHRGHPHRSPPRFRTTFLAAALNTAFTSSLAQQAQAQAAPSNGTLQLSSSFQAFQCQNMSIAWQGGVPAYSLTVVRSDHVEEFAGIAGTSFSWLVDAALGTPVFLSLFDSTGARTDSPVFNVISGPGSSDACLSSASSSTSVSGSSSSVSASAVPSTSMRETPSVLSFGAAESHLPPGALAAIVAEAAVLTLSVVGLLIIFFLDHKDRAREQSPSRASPPIDLLESPRLARSSDPYQPSDPESQSTTAGSSSASPWQPAAKELPLRTGTVRRGPSPTIQRAAAARRSFTPSEATFVGLSASPVASIRGSPSPSVRFALAPPVPGAGAHADAEKPRKTRRTALWQESGTPVPALAPASVAERVQSADLRDGGTGAVGGFDASAQGGMGEMGGEPRLLMGRFEA